MYNRRKAGGDDFANKYKELTTNRPAGATLDAMYATTNSDKARAGVVNNYSTKENTTDFVNKYTKNSMSNQAMLRGDFKKSFDNDYAAQADKAAPFNIKEMRFQNQLRPEIFKAESVAGKGQLFGDYFNYQPETFAMPKAPKRPELDAQGIAQGFIEQIKDFA